VGPTQLHAEGYSFSSPGIKQSVGGFDNTPPSSTDVKEGVELYIYSPFGRSWPVLEWPDLWVSSFLVFCNMTLFSFIDNYQIMGEHITYEGWNFNSGNYLFTTDTK